MSQCQRCKRAAHGGACSNPQPLPPAPVLDGARRAASVAAKATSTIKRDDEPDRADKAMRLKALTNGYHLARHYHIPEQDVPAWALSFARDFLAADYIGQRAMCFELDPVRAPATEEKR